MNSKGYVVNDNNIKINKYNYFFGNDYFTYRNTLEDTTEDTLFYLFEEVLSKLENIKILHITINWTYETFCYFCDIFNHYTTTTNKSIKLVRFGGFLSDKYLYDGYFHSLHHQTPNLEQFNFECCVTAETVRNVDIFIKDNEIIDKKETIIKWIFISKLFFIIDLLKKKYEDYNQFCCFNKKCINFPNNLTKWYYSTPEEKRKINKETEEEIEIITNSLDPTKKQ